MFSIERLSSIEKNDIPEVAKSIDCNELQQLVEWLADKDDKIRYQALLILQSRSTNYEDVYYYWDIFCEKLKSENSYQRSIGLMLIADNVKWDKDNKFEKIIDEYLLHLNDDKPITIRQCIQSFRKIIPYKEHLHFVIAEKIMAIDILRIKETMRKLILIDILEILMLIKKYETNDRIDNYILNAQNNGLLDKKAIKQLELMVK